MKYPVPFSIAQSIPYVDGVIRESWRIVPVTTFWSERIVPESGLELCDGKKIPPGTVVAMSGKLEFHRFATKR